ncbi:outer membrane beta-barrel protein [Aureisphaera galaxeae]|uniref:outer membrane beta-barrel protein n=1 Tax=Aureisphaera galaxeae TaxID=1538023 RepID=UPI0023508BA6|nr:outer membrane beta-barrel protein [Aureisphaera galaxeae]MDC8005029.1 outer membrane beta-barrel protein [Aureisphaera galaxeae]
MSDKKHIDDLFKEQLQHFEAAPSPEVWNNIQAKMKKEKDDRKVIPLWWRVGGVAALLALLLTVGNMVFNPFGGGDDPVLVDENTERSIEKEDDTPPITDKKIENEAISSEDGVEEIKKEEASSSDDTTPTDSQDQLLQKSRSGQEAVAVEEQEKVNNVAPNNDKLLKKDIGVDKNAPIKDAVVASENEEKQKAEDHNPFLDKQKDIDSQIKDAVVASEKEEKQKTEDFNPFLDKQKGVDTQIKDAQETGVVVENQVKEEQKKLDDEEELFKNPMEDKDPSKAIQDVNTAVTKAEEKKDEIQETPEDNKKSIFDAIAEDQETEIAKTDDKDARQWEVTPNFGPVFYNSFGEGSSIDPMFADNSQSGETNFSYGVQISYAINDKLSIRSGVSNVNLGYSTGDIELATGPVASALASVDYGGRSNVLTALDKGTLANVPPDTMNPFDNLRPKSTGGNNAELTQNLSYYEVPLELNYALLDRRFGINMIGGFSTLFLGDNEIVANDGDFREVLGEANNLSSVSFSTNIGLGFNYKISKRLKFNIEPMFKYQLNPYTDSSVDFRPYYLGVYSGLSFKF